MSPPHDYEVDLRALNSQSANFLSPLIVPLIDYLQSTPMTSLPSELTKKLSSVNPAIIFIIGCLFRTLAAFFFEDKAVIITFATGAVVYYLMKRNQADVGKDYDIVGREGKRVAGEMLKTKEGKEALRKPVNLEKGIAGGGIGGIDGSEVGMGGLKQRKNRIHGLDDTTVCIKNGRVVGGGKAGGKPEVKNTFSTMDTLGEGELVWKISGCGLSVGQQAD